MHSGQLGLIKLQNEITKYTDLVFIALGWLLVFLLFKIADIYPTFTWVTTIALIPLGICYLLFVPGYLLQIIIFPRNGDLSSSERISLSLTLSFAFMAIFGAAFYLIPIRLSNYSIMIGISVFLLISISLVVFLRVKLPQDIGYIPKLKFRKSTQLIKLTNLDHALFFIVFITFLLAILTVLYPVLTLHTNAMTEFFMLGKEEMAQDYPRSGQVGVPASLIVGVVNREGKAITYQVGVYQRGALIGKLERFRLEDGETIQVPLAFTPLQAGPDEQIDFNLYRDQQSEPYRVLRLFMTVTGEAVP